MLQVNSPNKDQIKQNTFFKCAFAIHPGFVCLFINALSRFAPYPI